MGKPFKVFLLLFLCGLVFFIANCGGGGGGGGGGQAQPVDTPAISETVNGFMSAVVSQNVTEARKFLSEKFLTLEGQVSGGTGKTLGTLIVWDFGASISNNADDASYTFTIPEGGIYQPSSEFAEVSANYLAKSGDSLAVTFKLGKEKGKWLIEEHIFHCRLFSDEEG